MQSDESISSSDEVRIQVPWGHIAGRWYGDQSERPILALHGWQDNCGTFAKLAPLIAPYRGLLCIDLPGHGRSSHLPPGILYNTIEYVRVILRLMHTYNWQKVSLLGHSMGGSVAFHFAGLYPDRVDMIISLEVIKSAFWPPEFLLSLWKHMAEKAVKDNERLLDNNCTEPPCYTFRECEMLMYEGSLKSLELDKCKYILERNVTKSKMHPGKYYFSRDGRIKYMTEPNPNMEMSLEMAKRICKRSMPYIVIRGGESGNASARPTELDDFMMEHNQKYESHICPKGRHHQHLNNARPVAEFIIGFLQKHDVDKRILVQSKI